MIFLSLGIAFSQTEIQNNLETNPDQRAYKNNLKATLLSFYWDYNAYKPVPKQYLGESNFLEYERNFFPHHSFYLGIGGRLSQPKKRATLQKSFNIEAGARTYFQKKFSKYNKGFFLRNGLMYWQSLVRHESIFTLGFSNNTSATVESIFLEDAKGFGFKSGIGYQTYINQVPFNFELGLLPSYRIVSRTYQNMYVDKPLYEEGFFLGGYFTFSLGLA